MRGIADTIARLAALSQRATGDAPTSDRFDPLTGFGSNPGDLRAYIHIPESLAAHAPLVVVLHGCAQSAAGYDRSSGWSELADEHGFALLYPEQQRPNNANGCFNWFEPADTRRDAGEVLAIRQMIAAAVTRHAIDPDRIFVTGLSAGGAMAATMLATYPEVFAGGAIIAGLPHGAAVGMAQAFDRMRGHGLPSTDRLEAAVRAESSHAGPWPRISIWHGDADRIVDAVNAEAIGAQWRGVHGLPDHPNEIEAVDGVARRIWRGPDGRVLIEEYIIPGMGHGTPLDTRGARALGSSAPFMLDVGISSTRHIAEFWSIIATETMPLTRQIAVRSPQVQTLDEPDTLPMPTMPRRISGTRIQPKGRARPSDYVTKVIEDAFRAAGLMK